MKQFTLIIYFLLAVSFILSAQSEKSIRQNKAVSKLSKSLEEGKSDEVLAGDYMTLALSLLSNKEYEKAETNFLKAREIYVKLKDNEKLAAIDREVAKIKEIQNLPDEASALYQSASQLAPEKKTQALNSIDAQRLSNQSDVQAQSVFINQKIDLLQDDKSANSEMTDAYRQLARTNLQMKQPEQAIENYEKALKNTSDTEEAIEKWKYGFRCTDLSVCFCFAET